MKCVAMWLMCYKANFFFVTTCLMNQANRQLDLAVQRTYLHDLSVRATLLSLMYVLV